MLFLITYEIKPAFLRSTNLVRQNLENTITELGTWWHYLRDTWIVETSMTAEQIANSVRQQLSEQDYLLVVSIQPPYQGWLPKEAWDWFNSAISGRFRTRWRNL